MTGIDHIQEAKAQDIAGDVEAFDAIVSRCRSHLLDRLALTRAGDHPFRHLFVEQLFPADVYEIIHGHMLACKYGDDVQDRNQDNPAFLNKRFNLFHNKDEVTRIVRAVFSDEGIKRALLAKFYLDPSADLADELEIHKEFEYFFTAAGRFQNIHIDIPPKFLSFVVYIPEKPLPPHEEGSNATILYDKDLEPHHKARFVPNSMCVFAPHYYSYHGFNSTMDRDVLVMFYVHRGELKAWRNARSEGPETPPFIDVLDAVEHKLRAFPLIEIGTIEARLLDERRSCRVNAPQGRVLRDPPAIDGSAPRNA